MAWGVGSVYLRLKKRHPGDKDAHTLQAGEVEKDLGLETIVEAAQGLALDDLEEEEDGDLTIIVNPSCEVELATHDTKGAATQSSSKQGSVGGAPHCHGARARRHSFSPGAVDCVRQLCGQTEVLKLQSSLLNIARMT
ncbi:uncharacterized protein LOC117194276 [Drosophila miranda]|uniref:uncharacterized protein LOC117194276 n=1 Tax=Drosophila miranda TaxID=7229 RepID=UPI00143F1771|nr:uncharacterized protein LOC117194276 [Drosophila miranda]